ncbi:MAG: LytTR family DNA-binding domain-containing protein [Clostridia bacterium]|jgi:two-component system LytT family response regulator/two-component system response regulator LytT|nr:LytTR family DNA-binding domain-containing protein [Clostridia bacterium]
MLKAVLVDDEPLSLESLAFLLQRHQDIAVVGSYTDPLTALDKIKTLRPELIFLDIEMPELDGLSMAREITAMGFDPLIVFATVFEQYAVDAFEINAADYIVKPFSAGRVSLTVNRLIRNIKNRQVPACPVQALLKHTPSRPVINKIPVWQENNILLVDPKRILYFSVENKKVLAHTKDAAYENTCALAELEERLAGKGFFRCHKSFLVNTDYIVHIIPWVNSTYLLRLKETAVQIPVSRLYTKKLKGMLSL